MMKKHKIHKKRGCTTIWDSPLLSLSSQSVVMTEIYAHINQADHKNITQRIQSAVHEDFLGDGDDDSDFN